MWLQESVNYTSAIRDRGTLLVTSGHCPAVGVQLPGRHARAYALGADHAVGLNEVDLRGPRRRVGALGPLEFDATGKFTSAYDTGWVAMMVLSGFSAEAGNRPSVRRIGDAVYFKGTAAGTSGTSGNTFPVQIPTSVAARPEAGTYRDGFLYVGTAVAARLRVLDDGRIQMNGHRTSASVNVSLSSINYLL